jgi:hypothetical protein
MIDILHNIGKGVGAVVSGLALLFAGASNIHTQLTLSLQALR